MIISVSGYDFEDFSKTIIQLKNINEKLASASKRDCYCCNGIIEVDLTVEEYKLLHKIID